MRPVRSGGGVMEGKLYPTYRNPLIRKPARAFPRDVAIVGAGTIGPDIGYYLKSALPGIRLTLVDVVARPLDNAKKRLADYVRKALEKGKMSPEAAAAVSANILYSMDYSDIKEADIVIEAATEDVNLKRKIFGQIETMVSSDTILTSNTSSLPAERIFSELKRPQRATVTHFFAPAWKNPAVEVINWPKVDLNIVDYLLWLFCMTGKTPIVSRSVICFLLDRIFDNWCNEAGNLLNQATSVEIDKVAEAFVSAGPFFVLNMARGNPLVVETNNLQMEEGEHYRPAKIFESVDKWLTFPPGVSVQVPEEIALQVRDRLLGILFSQSFDIVDRKIGLMEDLNLGCQIALGFRKGPLDIMGDLGEKEVRRIIKRFLKERAGMPGPKKAVSHYQRFNRHILVDEIEGVNVITIRRPQFMNALSDEVNDEIFNVLTEGEKSPNVKGFIMTGYGDRAFSAGAEIGRFPEMLGDPERSVRYARDCSKLLRFIDRMEKPVVAAVNGMALGGGAELAIRCHRMVVKYDAWFQFPEVTLGILPGIGGMVVPYRKWPNSSNLFHDMIMFGKTMTAREAIERGIACRGASDYADLVENALEEVNALSGRVERIPDGPIGIEETPDLSEPRAGDLPLSREVVQIISLALRRAAEASTFAEALEVGYRAFGDVACTEAAREGIAAFLEKRKPVFKR